MSKSSNFFSYPPLTTSSRVKFLLGLGLFIVPFGVLLIGITMSSQVINSIIAIPYFNPIVAIVVAAVGFFFWAALFGKNIIEWWRNWFSSKNNKLFVMHRHHKNLEHAGPRQLRSLERFGTSNIDDPTTKWLIHEISASLKLARANHSLKLSDHRHYLPSEEPIHDIKFASIVNQLQQAEQTLSKVEQQQAYSLLRKLFDQYGDCLTSQTDTQHNKLPSQSSSVFVKDALAIWLFVSLLTLGIGYAVLMPTSFLALVTQPIILAIFLGSPITLLGITLIRMRSTKPSSHKDPDQQKLPTRNQFFAQLNALIDNTNNTNKDSPSTLKLLLSSFAVELISLGTLYGLGYVWLKPHQILMLFTNPILFCVASLFTLVLTLVTLFRLYNTGNCQQSITPAIRQYIHQSFNVFEQCLAWGAACKNSKQANLYQDFCKLLIANHIETKERKTIAGTSVGLAKFAIKFLGFFNCFVHASATFWGGFQLLVALTSVAFLAHLPFGMSTLLITCMIGTGLLAAGTLTRKAIYKFYYNEFTVPFFTEKCLHLQQRVLNRLDRYTLPQKQQMFQSKSWLEKKLMGKPGIIFSAITACGFAVFSYQAGYNVIPALLSMYGINYHNPILFTLIGGLWSISTLFSSNSFYGFFRKQPLPKTAHLSWPTKLMFYGIPLAPTLATSWMLFHATVSLHSPWVRLFHNIMSLSTAQHLSVALAVVLCLANIILIYKLFLVGMDRLYHFFGGSRNNQQLFGMVAGYQQAHPLKPPKTKALPLALSATPTDGVNCDATP